MRGEVCIGSASLLSFVAVLILIFTHIGQINTSTVSRGIYLINVNMTGYGAGLQGATGDPTPGLYNDNATAPLDENLGLRQSYQWGFYKYCAYTNATQGQCSNSTFGYPFQPFPTILGDTPELYNIQTQFILPTVTFTDSGYLADYSRAGFWLVFLGSIGAILALLSGAYRNTATFLLATSFSVFSTACLLIGASIYTAILNKSLSINGYRVSDGTPLGIKLTVGPALWLIWASFVCMFLSIGPYLISGVTYRK